MRLFATVLLLFLSASARSQADPLSDGAALSKLHCARCHVVDPDNRFSGISSTPSFMLLVDNFEDWRERFSTFFARPPHPALVRMEGVPPLNEQPPSSVPILLTTADVEAILLYAESLKAN